MRSHIVLESVILHARYIKIKIMFGKEYGWKILKIPLSGYTISQPIKNLSENKLK